jgi:uncharacterized membrane protein
MKFNRIWRHPLFWLAVMVTAFFAVSLYAGIVAYYNFHTHNSTDAGIITQAVSSATFGRRAPFYESYDCMVKDRCSFLLVHPGAVLYLAAPFYALAPTTITLFALRSLFVAAAAVPLYWLTRQVTKSQGQGLLAAGIYLLWAPTLAGDAFSLHLESLLPLELLGLAALWQAGRYRWGLFAALAAFLTFEIAPIFVFLVGLFFLAPIAERWARRVWRRFRHRTCFESYQETTRIPWAASIQSGLKSRELRYTLILMAASVVAYVALYSFMNIWGYWLLGVSPPSVPGGITGLFYNSSTPPAQSLTTLLSSRQTRYTAEYWFVLLGLLAFLPLFSPRSLIISVPWIGWTFLTDSARFTTIGSQYTLVAAGPLFIGLAYGFGRIPFDGLRSALLQLPSARADSTAPEAVISRRQRWRTRGEASAVATVLTGIVVTNVLFSPINPVLSDLGFHPSAPFDPGYFDNPLTITPGYAWAEQLISDVPRNASIVTSSALFPLLANYPDAFVLEPHAQPFTDSQYLAHLPFNVTTGPEFVLLELSQVKSISAPFAQNLSNPTLYGLRGYVWSTAVGPLLLYQQHYTSLPADYGPISFSETNATYWPHHGLSIGPIGKFGTNPTAPEGSIIRSLPKVNPTGEVWTGPDTLLVPGNYTLRFQVSVTGSHLRSDPSAKVLGLAVAGFGALLLNESFAGSAFVSGEWTNLTATITVPFPVAEVGCDGFLLNTNVSVAIAYLAVDSLQSA